MAFDFVSYIGQQVEQQQPQLLASQPKAQRKQFILHILALQIAELISAQKKNPQHVYTQIQDQDTAQLIKQTISHIENEEKAQQYFAPIQSQLQSANQDIAQLFLQELKHLDQSASLGQDGIAELIDGQKDWLQLYTDDWFWDSIGQPENKPKKDLEVAQSVDSQQVMKQFSQMMSQNTPQDTAMHMNTQTDELIHTTTSKHVNELTPTPISAFYLFLNPLIALAIIIFIFNLLF